MPSRVLHCLLPCLVLLLTMRPAHSAFLHLCPAGAAPPGAVLASAPTLDGALRFVVTDAPARPGCRSLDLGGARVEALHVPGPEAARAAAIVLQGQEAAGGFVVEEQTLVPREAATGSGAATAMPLHANLLPAATVRSYGSEERVQVRLQAGTLHIACRPGARPAGVLLSGPWHVPRLRGALVVRFSGNGRFAWRAADAALAAREAALDMGVLEAAGMVVGTRLAFPHELDRAGWRHFVLACPAAGGTLVLHHLALEPDPPLPGAAPPRASWVWDERAWRGEAGALLDWAAAEGLGELFIAVPQARGQVEDAAGLSAFVARAGARGIAVSAVEGDPHMVLPAGRAAAATRARALAAYNRAAAPAARLRSLQFDIEPYLLPASLLPPARMEQAYLASAAALRQAAGELPLDFVLPYWWGDRPTLLAGLARSADAITVMDYRTDAEEIVRFAVPFLDWGAAHGKRVRIALEAGPLPPARQRHYRPAAAGAPADMLLYRVDGQDVLVLLRWPLADPRAQPYRLAGSRAIDGSATSFHADKAALRAMLPRLEADFSAWPGFAGIALHELR